MFEHYQRPPIVVWIMTRWSKYGTNPIVVLNKNVKIRSLPIWTKYAEIINDHMLTN